MNRGIGYAVLYREMRSESRDLSDPRSFLDFVSGVCFYIVKLLHQTTRPTNFKLLYCGINSQAEMEPRIAARVIASATMDFVDLTHARCGHCHPSSDGCAVALRSYQLK